MRGAVCAMVATRPAVSHPCSGSDTPPVGRRPLNRRNSERVSGMINHYAIARTGKQPQDQRQPADCTIDHHNLIRLRG